MLRKDHEDENQTLETGHVALEMSGKLAQIVSKHEVSYILLHEEDWDLMTELSSSQKQLRSHGFIFQFAIDDSYCPYLN